MTVTLYGIPNCDTVKKARRWLEANGVEYSFHDYKKQGVDEAKLGGWTAQLGWEKLLNRAGTTFRKLPEADRAGLDAGPSGAQRAIALMLAHPSAIRRPVIEHPRGLLVGFGEAEWGDALL
jgi:Spx/MgsR family transcriptional regulator